jgi:hypothetical protein
MKENAVILCSLFNAEIEVPMFKLNKILGKLARLIYLIMKKP